VTSLISSVICLVSCLLLPSAAKAALPCDVIDTAEAVP
jgi:hypothetical protein